MLMGEWEREVLREFHIAGAPLSYDHIKERTGREVRACQRTVRRLLERDFLRTDSVWKFYHSWTYHYEITERGTAALFDVFALGGRPQQLSAKETNLVLQELFKKSKKDFMAYKGVGLNGEKVFDYENTIIF